MGANILYALLSAHHKEETNKCTWCKSNKFISSLKTRLILNNSALKSRPSITQRIYPDRGWWGDTAQVSNEGIWTKKCAIQSGKKCKSWRQKVTEIQKKEIKRMTEKSTGAKWKSLFPSEQFPKLKCLYIPKSRGELRLPRLISNVPEMENEQKIKDEFVTKQQAVRRRHHARVACSTSRTICIKFYR